MPFRLTLDTLLLYDPDHASSVTNVWVARPTPGEEQTYGKLFLISAIATPDRLNHEIITILQDELKANYYQGPDQKTDIAFEQALNKTNQRLHQLIIEGISTWVDQAHFLAGVIRQQHLVLSSVGTMCGYVLRGGRLVDVLGGPLPNKPNPLRIFSSTVTGEMTPHDRFLFCTPSLLDYFSLEKLRRMMLDHSPNETVRSIETHLLGADPKVAFGALLLQAEPEVDAVRTLPAASRPTNVPQTRNAPQVSMEELIARERETQRLLSPSVWPAVKDITHQISLGARNLVRTRLLKRPPRRIAPSAASSVITPQPPSTFPWRRRFGLLFRSMGRAMQAIFRGCRRLMKAFRRTDTPTAPAGPAFPQPRRRIFDSIVRWFVQLSRARQIIIVGGLLILLILSTAIVQSGFQHTGSNATVKSPIAAATENIVKAEAAVLYGGEDIARQNIEAAKASLAKVPHRTKKEKTERSDLERRIAAVEQAIAHQTNLPKPEVLADLSQVKTGYNPGQLYLFADRLAVVDPAQAAVVTTTIKGQVKPTISTNSLDTGHLLTGAVSGTGSLVFVTDRTTLVELNADKNIWQPLDATFPKPTGRIQSIAPYQGRLYVLDQTENQILRFQRAGQSYGTGIAWLKETVTLREARTIVVDGTVYALQPGGIVTAMAAGRPTGFKLQAVTPPLRDATRLWTDGKSLHLYLVDPANRRLLVFDKTGKLLDQYRSDVWTNLKDVTADEKTKTAYVLNGSAVYRVLLLH